MKRRTLDVVFSVGGLLLAGLLLVLGLVLQNQADFAKNYVKDQLSQQKITFTPVAGLAPQEKQATCLVKYASKPLTTGKQAECYANKYIGLHVTEVNGGKTYAETSGAARALQAKADAAAKTAPNAPETVALQSQAKALSGKVDTLFRGETLRGLLLTSYGFSIFGERAQQAALVSFAAAFVLLLASIAGFIHAFTTSKDEVVLTANNGD
ncbi:MAG: hypothetical protein ACXVKA_07550 [Acidimicrobiia bacterium]